MTRLYFVVEGMTELRFVQNVLSPHLAQFLVNVPKPRLVLFGEHGGNVYRGGLKTYQKPRKHLTERMKEDQSHDAYFTTMFDLYALPSDFPNYAHAQQVQEPYDRVRLLEEAFANDLRDDRFIPYIQLHEFEALLFADVQQFDWEFLEHEVQIRKLKQIADKLGNPELIDNGAETAPSKRIIKEIPEYKGRKSSAGAIIAQKIGLPTLRQKCRHFHDWLARLEQLGASAMN
jgi:hypothetical protein